MGRGSSSAGGGREPGGSGVNPKNIKNVEEMISVRNEGNQKQVDDVLTVSRELTDKYGASVATGGFDIADFTGKDSTTLGCYSPGGGITMNRRFLDNQNMDKVIDESAKSGYHPSRGKKSGMYAVAAHEYGHSLTENVREKMGEKNFDKAAERIVTEARKQTGDRGNIKFARNISKYATASNAETVAEAVTDVMCNGGKAKKQSKAVVSVIDKYLL